MTNKKNDAKIEELSIMLDISLGGFVICTYQDESVFEDLFQKLSVKLTQKNMVLRSIDKEFSFPELETFLKSHKINNNQALQNNPTKNIFSIKWDERILKKVIDDFNTRRDFYAQKSGSTIILWIPQPILKWLVNQTPDFWRIRLGTFSFKNEKYTNVESIAIYERSTQREVINALVKLRYHYRDSVQWNKNIEYDLKIKEYENIEFPKNIISNIRILNEINDISSELIRCGFTTEGMELHSIVIDACSETTGSVKTIKNEFKNHLKIFYKKIADAFFENENYVQSKKYYKMILRNTSIFSDRSLRKEISEKLSHMP